jgi:LemA protein
MLWWIWLIIALVALLIIIFIYYFNRFAVLKNRIENSLGQIDVQLKRRADLIPNLVETVKGYAKHENAAIKAVRDFMNQPPIGLNLNLPEIVKFTLSYSVILI